MILKAAYIRLTMWSPLNRPGRLRSWYFCVESLTSNPFMPRVATSKPIFWTSCGDIFSNFSIAPSRYITASSRSTPGVLLRNVAWAISLRRFRASSATSLVGSTSTAFR